MEIRIRHANDKNAVWFRPQKTQKVQLTISAIEVDEDGIILVTPDDFYVMDKRHLFIIES